MVTFDPRGNRRSDRPSDPDGYAHADAELVARMRSPCSTRPIAVTSTNGHDPSMRGHPDEIDQALATHGDTVADQLAAGGWNRRVLDDDRTDATLTRLRSTAS